MGFNSNGKYLEYWGFTISGNQNTGAEPFKFLRVPWGYLLSPVTAWPLFCSQQTAHGLIVVTDFKCQCKISKHRCCFNPYFSDISTVEHHPPQFNFSMRVSKHSFGLLLLCYFSVPDSGIQWTIAHTPGIMEVDCH